MNDDTIVTETESDILYHLRLLRWIDKQRNRTQLIQEFQTTKSIDEFGKKVGIIRINTYIAKKLPRIIDEPIPEKRKYILDN